MTEINEESSLTRHTFETESSISSKVKDTENHQKKAKKTIPFHKIFSFADFTDKIFMIIGTFAAIGNGLSQPLMSHIFGELIDVFGESQNHDTVSRVSKISLKFVYLGLGCGLAAFLQVSCWMVTGERQAARIRTLYLKTILRQEIAYFDNNVNTGEVNGRMTNDTILIQEAIGEKVGKFVQVLASFLGGFAIAFINGWLLTLVMLTSIPLIVITSAVMHVLISRIASKAQIAQANAANLVQQTISTIRTVASFSGEKQAVVKYKKFLDSSYKCDLHVGLSIGIGGGLAFFITLSSYGLAVWFGAKTILHNGYTGGEVFTVLLAVIVGSSSLSQASPCLAAFAAGQAAAFKIFVTINRKPSIDAYDTKGKTLNDIRGDVELRNVCFSYPSRPKEQIFNGFSLFIPSGTSMAMVGQSGSGKSTVISLIERFYDPQAGQVLIDGIDLRNFQLKWIRSKIGLVSQEPVLFTGSIKDNIAYGKDGASFEEIIAAAKLANAIDFIEKLPQGLDTTVGENGVQISGGQKQRVAIARAILKNPQILLLDEATSALDAESERIVQDSLDKIMVNRTTVVVAHRLSTIRNADVIAVLHQGKIIEKGSHFELLKDPQGMYSTLVSSQQLKQDYETMNSSSSQVYSDSNSNTNHIALSFSKTEVPNKNVVYPQTSKNHPKVSIFRLARLNKPEIPLLILGAILAIITGSMYPLVGFIISGVISIFYEPPHKLQKDSEFWALMFVFLGVVALIASVSKAYVFGVSGNKLIRRIRLKCFEKVINMEISWFDKPENSSGVIGTRLSSDAAMVRFLVGDALGQIVRDSVSVLGGLAIAFGASWQLSLIILALIPLIIFNNYAQMKYREGFSADSKITYEEASQVANDAIGNIRTVSSFCAQERIIETYEKKCEATAANGNQQGLISGIGFGLSTFLLYAIYAACFYAGGRFVQDGKITMADVFRVFFALTMVGIAISTSSTFAAESTKAKSAAASIFAILDGKSRNDPSDESGMTLENFNGEIELSHVDFNYPTRPGVQIFRDLSLTIHSGKIVAVVGESGSGKSTLISLLQRFYEPDSGHIRVDGIDIQKLQLKWLRQQMGLVSQEPILFNDTIRANIAIGKGGSGTEAEIVYAAKLANAHEFISALQQGYDTIVGERGVQLSGGQKQRLAIARVILKNPKILLLDEATSALDSESEKIVQEALDKVMLDRTTVIVAHRLSTIRRADEIVVFKNGNIVEKGNHNTLMNIKDGYYSSLVNLHKNSMG